MQLDGLQTARTRAAARASTLRAAGLRLRRFAAGDSVIVELPLGEPAFDVRYMFYSTRHWHRLVNGYRGGVPPSYEQLDEALEDLTLGRRTRGTRSCSTSHRTRSFTTHTMRVTAAQRSTVASVERRPRDRVLRQRSRLRHRGSGLGVWDSLSGRVVPRRDSIRIPTTIIYTGTSRESRVNESRVPNTTRCAAIRWPTWPPSSTR